MSADVLPGLFVLIYQSGTWFSVPETVTCLSKPGIIGSVLVVAPLTPPPLRKGTIVQKGGTLTLGLLYTSVGPPPLRKGIKSSLLRLLKLLKLCRTTVL